MIRILSSAQIKEAHRYTIQHEPVSSTDLMERAARQFVKAFTEIYPASVPVKIFCGYGNNGGDGLAIARMLYQKNYHIEAFLLADKSDYSTDLQHNLERLLEVKRDGIIYLYHENQFPVLAEDEVIIDALFGSGLNRRLTGLPETVINHLNRQLSKKVSVDIPSGLYADRVADGIVFKAHQTITFEQPKFSFLFAENYEFVGDWIVVNIGLHPEFILHADCHDFIIEKDDVRKILKPRKKFDHKGTYGHTLILAGNTGKMGAAIMCASACIRSGAGLTTVLVPEGQSASLNMTIPEAMTIEYPAGKQFPVENLSRYSAFAAGPGIGTSEVSKKILLELLDERKIPSVLDADALNIVAGIKKGLRVLAKETIITPHPKEFERLAGKTKNWFENYQLQIKLSKKYRLYIVLKGAYTRISTPEGNCYFNPTGNPGMAKGGSGDVLTGMIGAFLAQKYSPEESCLLGVYLHGLSADIAVQNESLYSLTASDIVSSIGNAFREVSMQ